MINDVINVIKEMENAGLLNKVIDVVAPKDFDANKLLNRLETENNINPKECTNDEYGNLIIDALINEFDEELKYAAIKAEIGNDDISDEIYDKVGKVMADVLNCCYKIRKNIFTAYFVMDKFEKIMMKKLEEHAHKTIGEYYYNILTIPFEKEYNIKEDMDIDNYIIAIGKALFDKYKDELIAIYGREEDMITDEEEVKMKELRNIAYYGIMNYYKFNNKTKVDVMYDKVFDEFEKYIK